MRLLNWLTTFSVQRASVILLITFAVAGFGIVSIFQTRTELVPNIDFPSLAVITQYRSAAPADVVDDVTRPIEQRLGSINGIEEMRSVSGDGISVVVLNFDFGTDMDQRESEVGTLLQGFPVPPGATRPQLIRASFNQVPVVQFSISSDELDDSELEALVRQDLLPELASIDGVTSAELHGGSDERVNVSLDPDALNNAGLTASQVAQFIRDTDVSQPAGSVAGSETTLPVRAGHDLESIDALRDLTVPAPGGAVPLNALGSVEVQPAPTQGLVITNGQRAIGVNVVKSEDGNTVDVSNEAVSKAREFAEEHPEVSVETVVDQSEFIEESIGGLLREGIIGGVMAVLIVYLFLGSLRATLVTAVSIPLSILIAMIVMNVQGLTINIFTLGGLTVAVGRVIDDSIVVLENVVRHVQLGERIHRAIVLGTREVASAITSSTLTTVAVFLPIGLVGGIVGQLFFAFALAVAAALLGSLLVAITIIPVLARFFVRRGEVRQSEGDEHGGLGRLQRWYTPILTWALDHRAITLVIAGVTFVGSFAIVPFLPVTFLPEMGEAQFQVSVTPPPGASQDAVEDIVLAIGEQAEQLDDFDVYQATIGGAGGTFETLGAVFSGRGAGGARMVVRLEDGADVDEARERMRAAMAPIQRETGALIAVERGGGGPPGMSSLEIIVQGDNTEAIASMSDRIVEALSPLDDLANLTTDVRRSSAQLAIQVDP
ncbi:MAG TPA: efflux RND transporter permease subunit, partial [Dehalococcoidia bacterium]|nr:efflux RND transporter permease subunit [Dehalococcoidia bacterium]